METKVVGLIDAVLLVSVPLRGLDMWKQAALNGYLSHCRMFQSPCGD